MTFIQPGLIEIDPQTLAVLLAAGDAVVVDVREIEEWHGERIPGALCQPMSAFEPAAWPVFPGRTIVIACLGGVRSAAIGRKLLSCGQSWVVHLKGGLNAWKAAGLPVEGGTSC